MHVLYSRKTASQKRAILSRISGSASLDQYIALVRGRIDSLLTTEPHNTITLCLFLHILNRLSTTENQRLAITRVVPRPLPRSNRAQVVPRKLPGLEASALLTKSLTGHLPFIGKQHHPRSTDQLTTKALTAYTISQY
jgi:hypothetical protein